MEVHKSIPRDALISSLLWHWRALTACHPGMLAMLMLTGDIVVVHSVAILSRHTIFSANRAQVANKQSCVIKLTRTLLRASHSIHSFMAARLIDVPLPSPSSIGSGTRPECTCLDGCPGQPRWSIRLCQQAPIVHESSALSVRANGSTRGWIHHSPIWFGCHHRLVDKDKQARCGKE